MAGQSSQKLCGGHSNIGRSKVRSFTVACEVVYHVCFLERVVLFIMAVLEYQSCSSFCLVVDNEVQILVWGCGFHSILNYISL